MKSLLGYFKNYIKESLLGPLFKLLEACFELAVPLVIAKIVDDIIPHRNQHQLVSMILLLVVFAVVGVCVALTAQYFSAKAAVGYTKELTKDLYDKVLTLPKEQRDLLSADSILSRLSSDTLQIQTGINSFLRLFLRAPIVVFGSFIMAFSISPRLSLYFLAMIVVLILIVTAVSMIMNRYYDQLRQILDKMVTSVRENVLGVRVIRAFGQKEREIKQFSDENAAYMHKQIQAGYWSAFLTPATFIVVNVTLIVLIWNGNLAIQHHLLEQGMLVALTNYLSQILVELIKMVTVVATMNQTFISAKRVQAIFDLESENVTAPLPAAQASAQARLIEAEKVNFSYPRAAELALEGIDFKLDAGQFMGIIGGTGSGKSTLVQLLMHLYAPTAGRLQVFKNELSPKNLLDWRHQFALVPQQAQLFSGTVRSNLTLGLEEVSDEAIWRALEIAQAKDFIAEKDGLDTVVEAFGRNFSGGQRQRLTIARALMQDASILVLDDSTSALDYLTESKLLTAVRTHLPDKAIVMISQRTNSIRHADQILVLDKGRSVGLGTHEELVQTSSVYREIDQSQHSKEVAE